MLNEDLNMKIQSLNKKQRKTFDAILQWTREFVKNKSATVSIDLLNVFIAGKGGCGKSHLRKTIVFSLTKTLSYHATESSKQNVLLLAQTGVAAINIHSALKIPVGRFGKMYHNLVTNCDHHCEINYQSFK